MDPDKNHHRHLAATSSVQIPAEQKYNVWRIKKQIPTGIFAVWLGRIDVQERLELFQI